ncbi:MAG TPA: acyl-CoA carboxylase subunit epsilon [Micromonosporaceae bacterium]
MAEDANPEAYIRIERGVPTDEELAALVGVLQALPRGPAGSPVLVSRWARSPRPPATERGPGAWRASALPR